MRPKFRLNVFGFLALEELSNSSTVPTSGNYALSDIIGKNNPLLLNVNINFTSVFLAALEWIQINIEHFGGDKHSVS